MVSITAAPNTRTTGFFFISTNNSPYLGNSTKQTEMLCQQEIVSALSNGDTAYDRDRHPFNSSFPKQLHKPASERLNQSGFWWSKKWRGGSVISWIICKSSGRRSRQITTPAPPHHSIFHRPDALPDAQPTASKALTANADDWITL